MGSYRPLHTCEQRSDTLHLPLPSRLESLKQKEKKTKDKMPMSHFTFLEKISEGLFVEGVNHRRGGEKPIDIAASSPQQLEDLIQSSNRRCQRPRVGRPRLHDEHLCGEDEDMSEHVIRNVPKWAIERGRAYCGLYSCPEAATKD